MKLYEAVAIIVWHYDKSDVITSSFEDSQDNLGKDIDWEE